MPEEKFLRRRLPAVERRIIDIHPEIDVRVKLIGTVIDTSANSMILDDGTGKVEIILDEQPYFQPGQLVKVIARVLPLIDGFECKGETIQNLEGFNLDLYRKAKEVIKSVGYV